MPNDQMIVKRLSIDEFHAAPHTSPLQRLIDVRELDEWEQVHIPGVRHIPLGTLASCIEQYFPEKDLPIYLHCHKGGRSLRAGDALIQLGYQNVYSLDGGISDWEVSGYPVIRG